MKRYTMQGTGYSEERADGYWVKFDDYAADRAALVEQLAAEQRMRKVAERKLRQVRDEVSGLLEIVDVIIVSAGVSRG